MTDNYFQNIIMYNSKFDEGRDYWLGKLQGEIEMGCFPEDYNRQDNFEYESLNYIMDQELSFKILNMSNKSEFGTYMILLCGIVYLIYKYTGHEDNVIGMPMLERNEDSSGISGVLALRSRLNPSNTFKEMLMEVKTTITEASRYASIPFEKIAGMLDIKDNNGDVPVFRTIALMDNIHVNHLINDKGANTVFCFSISDGSISVSIKYRTKLYKQQTIMRIAEQFLTFLRVAVYKPGVRLNEIDILSDKEKKLILTEFNNTSAEYARDMMIHQVFEEQAGKTPDNVAAIFGGKELTYAELNRRANCVAALLRERGVEPDDIVAILAERSFEMIIGILGILKAGGAYLPINPGYPVERIKYILEDSDAGILLCCNVDEEVGTGFVGGVVNLQDSSIYEGTGDNLDLVGTSRNLAYVIYTSGSTGKPKGAMIEHYSVINRINWMQNKYPIGKEDVILQKTPFTFDVSVWELFWWSFAGAKVCFLSPGGEKDPGMIVKAIEKNKVTTLHFVPSMLNIFLDYIEGLEDQKPLANLRQVFASGEVLNANQVNKFNGLLNKKYGTKLINLYGPTEATVDVSYFDCSIGEEMDTIPIGKPIDNISLYIVDKNSMLQPMGVSGELTIAGDGLARGYLNRPELTTEKFVSCPFEEGKKMYRTGDLARWLPDGNIEYLGRMDTQVKIRGFRIELGEIEAAILRFETVKEAIVLPKENTAGEKYICAYFVSDKEMTTSELRGYLESFLPEYMIPSRFVQLERMPLTLNGKIDRKALPEPGNYMKSSASYEAPGNETEAKLVKIWEDVLGIKGIGVNDNFFEIGGNSLRAVVIAKNAKEENIGIPLEEIFKYRSIRKIVENMDCRETVTQTGDTLLLEDIGVNGKVLKFKHQNSITTYLFRSLPVGIILAHDWMLPWYYNHFIQICSQTGDDGKIVLDYAEGMFVHCDLISHVKIGYEELKEVADITGYIVENINEDKYVIICMDEYYLSEKPNYRKTHFVHESIIYGYDSVERKFIGYGFNGERIMDRLVFSYDEVLEAFEAGKVNYKETANYAKGQAVQLLSLIQEEVECEFDMGLFIKELNDFLLSKGNNQRTAILVRLDDRIIEYKDGERYESIPPDRVKYGLGIYDDVITAIERIAQVGDTSFDYRMCHILAEHKRGLLERLEYIVSKYEVGLDTIALIEEYRQIADTVEGIRLKVFEIMYSEDRSGNDYTQIKIVESIKLVRKNEQELLSRLLEQLKCI